MSDKLTRCVFDPTYYYGQRLLTDLVYSNRIAIVNNDKVKKTLDASSKRQKLTIFK